AARVKLRFDAKGWSLDGDTPADDFAVRGLLSLLGELRARGAADGGAADAAAQASVRVELPDRTLRVDLARTVDGDVLASVDGGPMTRVGDDLWRSAVRPAAAWRSPAALRFERARVVSVRIHDG